MTKRRSFSDKFKAMVALEALRGVHTTQEIAAKHKVSSNAGTFIAGAVLRDCGLASLETGEAILLYVEQGQDGPFASQVLSWDAATS